MSLMTFSKAMAASIHLAMETDPTFSLVGCEVFGLGPHNASLDEIRAKFADRVDYPPISEMANASLGLGAAMSGARTFVDIGSPAGIYMAMSQIIAEGGTARLMSGGQIKVPVVYHMMHGLRGAGGAPHSPSPQAMLWNAPGLEIVLPSTPYDVKGLMLTGIRSDNPTLVFTHSKLLDQKEDVPDDEYAIPFGVADVKRSGRDITIVATSLSVHVALKAADRLADDGIDPEVVDPRTLVPFDWDGILASVRKTGRLVVVDETNQHCGVASEIAAHIQEFGHRLLKAPIARVARTNVPVAASPPLESFITPTAEKVVAAVRRTLGKHA